jgi:ATP-dependent DNA ligase
LRGVSSIVIDGELVACDDRGMPDFLALTTRGALEARPLTSALLDLLQLQRVS